MIEFFANNIELCFFAVSVASYMGGVLTGSYMHRVDFSDWGEPETRDPHDPDYQAAMDDIPDFLKRQAE